MPLLAGREPWYRPGRPGVDGWYWRAKDGKTHGPYRSQMVAMRDFRDGFKRCGCGHNVKDCRPEVCSSKFARDALWGNT